jgi:pilus assembly protein FimV
MKSAVRRILLMSALMSPSALYALGLGEIRLNSALNQPFDAEIELVSAAQEDLAALRASLASSETFMRYGLDKPAYLGEFTFRVARANGRDVLRITSPRPVSEPFVTLLVEASWPRGRLLREYTVLLDPPVFSPAPVDSEAPVSAPRASAPAPAATPVESRATSPGPAPAPPSSSEPRRPRPVAARSLEPGSTYRVRPNDTLWQIASSVNPGSRSEVNRAMVAIYQANPQAFGGNINVLRAGSDLTIPSSGDISGIPASEAAAEVARQYQMWRDGTVPAEGASTDGGRLRLVTPEQGSAAPSTATAAPATPTTGAASADLQSRVAQLEAELAEAKRLLEVRSAELATLQGAAQPAEGVAPAGTPAPEAQAPEATPAAEPAATEAPVEAGPAPEAEPEPTPAATAPAEEPAPSLLERLGQYWWMLVALLLAALGVTAFLRRRRESGAAEDDLEEALGRRASEDLRARSTLVARPRETDIVVEERQPAEPTMARTTTITGAPEPSRRAVSIDDTLSGEGPASIEAGDPLAEADFHMAYGLYDQAADLVQLAAKREPQRRDLKLKLLEIFFVWGNRDRFLEVAREMGGTRNQAPAGEWDKILIMGKQLAPDDPLFAGSVRATSSDSLDMNLQGSDATVDLDVFGGDAPAPDLDLTARGPQIESEAGLDFTLDEPQRGLQAEADALAPTVETQRIQPGRGDDPTAEVSIVDLGLDVGDIEGLDDFGEAEDMLASPRSTAEDTVERPTISRAAAATEEDLLSSTSILAPDVVAMLDATGDTRTEILDLGDVTGELPTIETQRLEATGVMKRIDYPPEGGESSTMSEVGTKLDLARAYVDMGDPEGARSILDEVMKEGSAVQKQEAERLMASLP